MTAYEIQDGTLREVADSPTRAVGGRMTPTTNNVGHTTSATERLRALLDERGVEWRRTPHYSSESIDNETVFRGEGIEWYANDHLNGRLGLRALRYEVTPEQAVEATLGRGRAEK